VLEQVSILFLERLGFVEAPRTLFNHWVLFWADSWIWWVKNVNVWAVVVFLKLYLKFLRAIRVLH